MDFTSHLRKRSKRRILVISAASIHSGLQSVYFEASGTNWEILHSQSNPYPESVGTLAKIAASGSRRRLRPADVALADRDISQLIAHTACDLLSRAPRARRKPDFVVFTKCTIWLGTVTAGPQQTLWCLQIGDANMLADSINTPVLTEFVRSSILSGGEGTLPTLDGDLIIAGHAGPVAVLLNLGLVSHMTIIDTRSQQVMLDADTGPCSRLIDLTAQAAGHGEGFDRDGLGASSGQVNTEVLDTLTMNFPGQDSNCSEDILHHPALEKLGDVDRLATVTAFCSLSIVNAYKRKCRSLPHPPSAIWLSGGSAYNQTLVGYLTAYFAPIDVKFIEELDVPANSRTPLALGLSIHAHLEGKPVAGNARGRNGNILPGRWVVPADNQGIVRLNSGEQPT